MARSGRAARVGASARRAFPAALSGTLLALAFPPLAFWPLAWVALAPWYVRLCGIADDDAQNARTRLRAGAGQGFVLGLFLFLVGMTWMNEIGTGPWIVLSFIEAVPFALLGAVCVWLLRRTAGPGEGWRRPLLVACLYVLCEGLRTLTRYSFPWFMLAASQVRALPLVQIVSATGQWGLTFALVLCGALVGEAWRRRRTAGNKRAAVRLAACALLVPSAVAVGGLALVGHATLSATGEEVSASVPVAIAQGNITKQYASANDRWDALAVYEGLTRQATAGGGPARPAFVAWPETVVPGLLLHDPVLLGRVRDLARAAQTPLLVGSVDIDEDERRLNSAFLLDSAGQIAGRYDKTQLVPIGEFFPLRALLGRAYDAYGAPQRDFSPGDRPGVLAIAGGNNGQNANTRAGVLICYESAFGRFARACVRDGAQVLVLLTSDQTFGTSAGPYQHADICALRAIETRRWIVRAASTGVSQIVDPQGRVRAFLPIGERGVLRGDVGLRGDQTLYVRAGDWFLGLCAALLLVAVAAGRNARAS